ncbi:MAG: hypothetical protein ACKVS9_07030 [Phycisphaerae bacterium]
MTVIRAGRKSGVEVEVDECWVCGGQNFDDEAMKLIEAAQRARNSKPRR